MEKIKINHLDLFSGIGGFHLGFERAGFEVNSYFSEIDKYAIQVYKHKFKNSNYVGSVTDVRGGDLPKIDIITFGSPCQDFSLAGKRKGLRGERSSLIGEAIRLIRETRPRVFIWENVKGTFSSNNRQDFTAILQAFANIGGYRLEWQLLNTKWFLPQNRERVYLVGYLGDGSGGEIFPIREGGRQTDELQRQQGNTCTLTTRYGADGNGSYIIERKLDAQEVRVKSATNQVVIGAMRGRNPSNPSGITTGSLTEQRLEINRNGTSNTLTSVGKDNLVVSDKIRRLTPVECERLQGFPDNWTKEGSEGMISDTQRYKMCGNAVTVDVVEAVANNIRKVVYAK
jgi:DNA (cytosine-5)-methyltransferase 1